MLYFRIFMFCICCVCIELPAFSQLRRCSTYEVSQLQGMDTKSFETWMKKQVEARKGQKIASSTVYTIPVIFHVIHTGTAAGSGYNISAAQIQAQVQQLNEDFRRIGNGFNTDARGSDSYIEFCLAATDTNGNALSEAGIDRINRSSKGWSAPPYGDCSGGFFDPSYIENTIKPQSVWDPSQYLNIWVMDVQCGLLGYAQMPEANAGVVAQLPDLNGYGGYANTDGVVINYFTVGSVCTPFSGGAPYDLGRTLTHEIGHFLGLHHIWGDAYCGTDYCGDTPTHEDYNWGIPVHPKANLCGTTDEMFENFMDYTDDETMNIFTEDQVTRMRVILENAPRRASLTSSNKCSVSATYPKISFVDGCAVSATALTEGTTNCSGAGYTTLTYDLHISRPPASNVTVRVGYSGTATYGNDFSLSDTLITFYAGADSTRTLALNIKKDALIESNETLTLSIHTVSGDNAVKDAIRQTVSVTINNDDQVPQTAAGIQQAVDTISGYAAFDFGPNQTVYYKDQSSAAIILSLTNNSSHDFGCTRVEIIRSGTGAQRAWTANTTDYITAKNFRIIPQYNNTTSASYEISLYYTESEIAGWESITGNNRSALQVIKTSGNIAQINPPTGPEYGFATHSTFGSGHIYTASYTTGFSSFGMGAFNSLLPVEWVSFEAEPKNDHIILHWKTASESPGTRFEIQRSTEPEYGFETLGWMDGKNMNNRLAEYTYYDYMAQENTLYYYRIINTDPYGKNESSELRTARIDKGNNADFVIFPTLFDAAITVKCRAASGNRRLMIINQMGNIVMNRPLTDDVMNIETGLLQAGMYIMTILEDNQLIFSQKIEKAK